MQNKHTDLSLKFEIIKDFINFEKNICAIDYNDNFLCMKQNQVDNSYGQPIFKVARASDHKNETFPNLKSQ